MIQIIINASGTLGNLGIFIFFMTLSVIAVSGYKRYKARINL